MLFLCLASIYPQNPKFVGFPYLMYSVANSLIFSCRINDTDVSFRVDKHLTALSF